MDLKIKKITVGDYRTNCYVLTKGSDLAIVDPGSDAEKIRAELTTYGTNFCYRYLLVTHAHHDHFTAVPEIIDSHPEFSVVAGEKEQGVFQELEWQEKYEGIKLPKIKVDCWITEKNQLEFGDSIIRVLETPGHTPGGIVFLIGNYLFSGDTLFYHTVGRTDLPGGDSKQLSDSLRKLLDLDEKIIVYPGHGKPTTIGEERGYYSL